MKVSIIIPCYNYGHYLPDCINSILNQTYPNWEAWIIDDGSLDCTPQVGQFWAQKDSRIHYKRQKNLGVSRARNFGVELCTGELIQFLDADDLLSPEKLEVQVREFAQNKSIDISYTENFYFQDGNPNEFYLDQEFNNRDWLRRFSGSGEKALSNLILNNLAVISSPLIKKDLVLKTGGFQEKIAHTEDWQFWLQCVLAGANVKFIAHSRAYTLIRVHPRSVSQNITKMQYGELALRTWLDNELRKSEKLNHREKLILIRSNLHRKALLVKHMMYLGPLNNWNHLLEISRLIPWYKVIWFYLKALNRKRKNKKEHPWKSLISSSYPTDKARS
ncbi:glycosyltransferase family 2 protein [Algoriphagus confluentis]|uniref:Glycosyltransferase 2-like domain-containing protein n=1 Tax=Algoriphagus confluentis TaxID=1697556 RepID=A0ABQ6PUA4_9BACT|nr:hypothetical protein Aconfl_41960 [Algoriphagus confluentis]